MANSVTAHYAAGVAAGRVESDDAQLAVLDMMARLETRIAEYRLARKSSSLGWLFAGRERTLPRIKGLYIYGDVGRGKTMLMDFFFEIEPGRAQAPRPFSRVHARRAPTRSRRAAGDQARRA